MSTLAITANSNILDGSPVQKGFLKRMFSRQNLQDAALGAGSSMLISFTTRTALMGAAATVGIGGFPLALGVAVVSSAAVGLNRHRMQYNKDKKAALAEGREIEGMFEGKYWAKYKKDLMRGTILSSVGAGGVWAYLHQPETSDFVSKITKPAFDYSREIGLTAAMEKAGAAIASNEYVAAYATPALSFAKDKVVAAAALGSGIFASIKNSALQFASAGFAKLPSASSAYAQFKDAFGLGDAVAQQATETQPHIEILKVKPVLATDLFPKAQSFKTGIPMLDNLASKVQETASKVSNEIAQYQAQHPVAAPSSGDEIVTKPVKTLVITPETMKAGVLDGGKIADNIKAAHEAFGPVSPVLDSALKSTNPYGSLNVTFDDKFNAAYEGIKKPTFLEMTVQAQQPSPVLPKTGRLSLAFAPAEQPVFAQPQTVLTVEQIQAASVVTVPRLDTVIQHLHERFDGQHFGPRTQALMTKAFDGDAQAQKTIASKLLNGAGGFKKDVGLAMEIYQNAAAKGNVQAIRDIAYITRHGLDGNAPNEKGAIEMLKGIAHKSKLARNMLAEITGEVAPKPHHAGKALKAATEHVVRHHANVPVPTLVHVPIPTHAPVHIVAPEHVPATHGHGKKVIHKAFDCVAKYTEHGVKLGGVCKDIPKEILSKIRPGDAWPPVLSKN